MASKRYATDLSDAEWSLLEPHLPAPHRRGSPRLHSPREILDKVFYVLKTGYQRRMDAPSWLPTVEDRVPLLQAAPYQGMGLPRGITRKMRSLCGFGMRAAQDRGYADFREHTF
jgi:hypothetical protein